jgi:Ser-tRNA(Ala) deacylase AlaX
MSSACKRSATRLLYLLDGETLKGTANIVSKTVKDPSQISIVLDKTHFYPQGGGQPSDIGQIDGYQVDHVHMDPTTKAVHHDCSYSGTDASPRIEENSAVSYQVDPKVRQLHCRLHSAGHLLDIVLFDKLGWGSFLTVAKAYHFPQGPNVEYKGDASSVIPKGQDVSAKQALIKQIEEYCNELISQDIPVNISIDPAEAYCEDGTPNDEATRWVQFYGKDESGNDTGSPRKIACGGTHVTSLKHIGKMTIRKIEYKASAQTLRVGYDVVY